MINRTERLCLIGSALSDIAWRLPVRDLPDKGGASVKR